MKPNQILKTTSRAPRLVLPPAAGAPAAPKAHDMPWSLVSAVGLLGSAWLALMALRPSEPWSLGLAYVACLLIVLTPRFQASKGGRPTLLLALGCAAILPVLAIGADLLGIVKASPSLVIAVTVAAVLAALASTFVARPAPPATAPATDDDGPVGRYRLVRQLGVGGMGEVWRAEHDTLARPAALKLIRRQRLEDPQLEQEMLERFRKEAEVTARLTSPHTVVLYDFGVTDNGVLYYAMELLDGMSVLQLVERFGRLDEARIAFLLRHACHSLIEAHDAGLVHRDLKPENLFVARLGRDEDFLKVLDFGLVKELESARGDPREKRPRMHLTIAGARPGTPGFMAPEQIVGTAPIDQRADVYGLGCVAYYMLTGGPVFQGKVEAQLLFAHVGTDPDRPSVRIGRPVHAGLEEVIMRCLAKEPAARPTMEQLDAMIAALVFDEPWSQARAHTWWENALGLMARRDAAARPTVGI